MNASRAVSRLTASALLALGLAAALPALGATKSRTAAAHASAPMALPFIADDYAKALAEARARNVPIFVEAWAPWCHTCRSMRANVFTDKSLESQAGKFVWLELDTEKAKNAPVRKRLAIPGLPSYFVLDPSDEHVMMRWVGSASVAQMHGMLDDALAQRKPPAGDADAVLARADRLYADGKSAEAAETYRNALAAGATDWAPRGRAKESLLFALYDAKDAKGAAQLAAEMLPSVAKTASAANVAGSGLTAALEMAASDPDRARLIEALEPATRSIVEDPTLEIAGDDRSGAYIALLDARKDAKDSLGAMRVAEAWAKALETDAAKAKTPDQRAVYDSHRLSAYLEIGKPERAIPMLQASERDLPGDYNPPARLAVAYQAMKDWDKALAASDRAMARAYGPRKLRFYNTRAEILTARGDGAGAKKTLEDALAFAQALPDGQRSEASIASLKKKLESLTQ